MTRRILLLVTIQAVLLGTGGVLAADTPLVLRDLEFARVDGHSLQLDLYQPAATDSTGSKPLVVWIHGGGWSKGTKDQCSVRWLVEHGYAVASISYRLTGQAIFPAQIHDCKAAIRWLRANADEYGYDAARIAAAGASAGGHLAALLGTSGGVESLEGTVGENLDQSSRVDAVIDFYGATDLVLRSRTQPLRANLPGSVVYRLLGGAALLKKELARLASPALHVTSDDPPLLILHGDRDRTVLLDQSQRIHDVYRAAKLPVRLLIVKGAGHEGHVFYAGERRQAVLAFLGDHL